MNIYLVRRTGKVDYDETRAFICYAEEDETARFMHPQHDGGMYWNKEFKRFEENIGGMIVPDDSYSCWPVDPSTLEVKYLGSHPDAGRSVILEDFKAG
jgi:hypothetical protein